MAAKIKKLLAKVERLQHILFFTPRLLTDTNGTSSQRSKIQIMFGRRMRKLWAKLLWSILHRCLLHPKQELVLS